MSSASSSSSSSSVVLAESFASLPSEPDSDSQNKTSVCESLSLCDFYMKQTFGVVLVFALAALLVVLEEDGRDEGLQVHQVLVEVASVLVLPDAALQVVLSGLTRGEDVDAGTVL